MAKNQAVLSEEATVRVREARECVEKAAALLSGINGELGRVSWMIEDVLTYIDEAERGVDSIQNAPFDVSAVLEDDESVLEDDQNEYKVS